MKYEYEVAISFAGEDRDFAEAVATGLREAGVNVFYDDFYAEDLWGEDLSVKLRDIYHGSSQFCIMILSENYITKMWPSHERQQAIERMIQQQGSTYILPVRLNGFNGEVPGLSGTISYLAVNSSGSQIIVDAFLRKIGREATLLKEHEPRQEIAKPYFPKLKRSYSDKDKNQFLKSSFSEITTLFNEFASATKQEYPHFDYEAEQITSRKFLFTFYESGKQVTQFKIWIGGSFGGNSIAVLHGQNIDADNDGQMNESISIEEHEGELALKPMGIISFGNMRNDPMSPKEIADYLWKIAFDHI